jgi:hypothetical protein
MSVYPVELFVRTVNPRTVDEYLLVGPSVADVLDEIVGDREKLDPTVARYVLAGTGQVFRGRATYAEDQTA